MGRRQPLVELEVDGRQDGLQPRHVDLSVVVQRVEPVVPEGFDHVPDIHQMDCEGKQTETVSVQSLVSQSQLKRGGNLTVASLLHKPQFAGGPVSGESDDIEVLSS